MKFYTVPVEMPDGRDMKVEDLIDILENHQFDHNSPMLKERHIIKEGVLYIDTGYTETVHYKIPETVLDIIKYRAEDLSLLPGNYATAIIIDYFRHRAFQHLSLGIEIGLYEEHHILEAAEHIENGGIL